MSLRQTLEVELEDGSTQVVEVDARDFRKWEAWRGESMIGSSTTISRLTEWAYVAGTRHGYWNGTYEDWEPTCVDVGMVNASTADPTKKDRSGGNSSPSQSEQGSARGSGKSQAKKR